MPRPVANPPNPWLSSHVEWLGPPPDAKLEVFEEQARSIVSNNDSPDIPFRWSINPYRGCFHGCAYCYARPTHEQLGFGAGTDFERKIVVKQNAAELLRARFERRSWTGEGLMFSGVTDCYQPLEAAYGLTRACLELCAEYRNPASVITKGALIRRDVELLARLEHEAAASVTLSVGFADDELARRIEPWASPPSRRLAAMRALADAGVPVGVSVSPVIPGLNDEQIPELLSLAKQAGARWAFLILLRLPGSVLPVFEQRLTEAAPLRAAKVLRALEDLRGGKRNDARFGARMRGQGPRWQAIESLFEAHRRRLGLAYTPRGPIAEAQTFRRPRAQRELF
ncbi:Radical SAM superfamily protein [Enhygromyxa salina]|uniref:Radical SAM superfamily protein n=1 Tax=Enhygromyxa salina TaxID=215803 RepID=A0A2S9XFK8_9BACT|nr:PA0069 family radical SAM protein [Enhygromyxa salina]PRP91654.1 Radical SAM superfamily protein [Enhygromyxa salina]